MDFNDKIKHLRISKGYSLKALADLVGVSKSAIQQYENGSSKPSNTVLKQIAIALGINVWDFFELENNKFSVESIKFRDGHKLDNPKAEIDALKNKTLNSIKGYIEIESIVREQINFTSPIDTKIQSNDDVEKATKKIRRKWKKGTAPINSVVDFLESIGIKIISISRDNDSPASCGWVDEMPIIILSNNLQHTWEVTRLRFSLMHEAAHLFFRNLVEDESKEEQFCNRFAASILLPDEAITSLIGKNRTSISLGELKRVKEIYGISIQSIIYRLNDLNLINAQSKEIMLNHYNDWRNEEKDFGVYDENKEKPKRFYDLLRRALTENSIGKYKAYEISNINIDDLREKLMINDKIDLV